jgi:F-type H+-transporting ATPase subunit b
MLPRLLLVFLVTLATWNLSAVAEEHAPADGHAAAAHDAPPELPGFKGDLAIWSFVTFLVFLFVVSKLAWEPLGGALSAREAKISGDIAAAEANRHKAEAMLRDYETKLAKAQEEVKEILAEARRDAEHTKQEIVAAANREADSSRQRAIADIEQAKNTALTELFEMTFANVVNLTERVLQKGMTSDDQERLVRQAMSELSARRN